MNDDTQQRLAAIDPLADPDATLPPAARLDAIRDRAIAGDRASGARAQRVWRPLAFGVIGAALLAGGAVAVGQLMPPSLAAAGAVVAGGTYTVKGSGCMPGAAVAIALDGASIGAGTAADAGTFAIAGTVPADETLGTHALTVDCTGPDGTTLRQSAAMDVVTPPTPWSQPPTFAVPGALTAGQATTAKGSGCAAGAAVALAFDGSPFATTIASAEGTFVASAAIPASATLGAHAMTATCSDPGGATLRQTAPIDVVTPPTGQPQTKPLP